VHDTSTGRNHQMKRTLAIAVLITALGVLVKLTYKQAGPDEGLSPGPTHAAAGSGHPGNSVSPPDPRAAVMAKYETAPPKSRELVARVAERFGQNALAIDRTDGLRGLELLDKLDLEAVFLYEKHPIEFRRLRDFLGGDAAADLLLHWREYFGLKHADDRDRGILIAEITNLTTEQKQIAAQYPSALPLILADPAAVTELIERMPLHDKDVVDVLAVLCFVSLEQGSSDLRCALRTFDRHASLALEAFRRHGFDGFALVSLYGSILEALGTALPLDQSLILLKVNGDYIDELLQTHRPETVAGHLRHVAATGLTEWVGGSPNALRLVVEFGAPGERALRQAGPDAADVVFGDFSDPALRRQAVAALATHGSMALAMLDKYATDPDFRAILRTNGADVIPPIAQADAGPQTLAYLGAKSRRTFTESLALAALFASGDNGQATIRTIKNDGLERVAQLNQSAIQFYQFLPLYDVIHLGNVMRRGYSPTSSEMTWALVDGCFVIADALSLAVIQPEGAVAAESIRSEVKAAVRQMTRSAGRELAETGAETTGKAVARHEAGTSLARLSGEGTARMSQRLQRWWAVREAGGLYQVLRQIPEAQSRMSLAQLTQMAGPLAAKAGMHLSAWQPIRLLRNGTEVVLSIPPQRGLKYLAAQAAQAGVGVVGFHKMEEHLSSRRPRSF
jgi:hypothetical protein